MIQSSDDLADIVEFRYLHIHYAGFYLPKLILCRIDVPLGATGAGKKVHLGVRKRAAKRKAAESAPPLAASSATQVAVPKKTITLAEYRKRQAGH